MFQENSIASTESDDSSNQVFVRAGEFIILNHFLANQLSFMIVTFTNYFIHSFIS